MASCLKLPCGIGSSTLTGTVPSSSSSSSSSSACSGRPQSSLRLQSEVQRVTVAILGARGVGKTALARQFVRCEFLEDHEKNKPTQTYFTSIVVNERIYEVKLVDCSGAIRFPLNSLQEWNEHRGHGLRNASAYVIVFDVTDEDSFRFARSIRERIVHSRNSHDVPMVVAANKLDLQVHGGGIGAGGTAPLGVSGTAVFGDRPTVKRDHGNVVRKQWKCAYVECSAKYNWRVVALFRELMKAADNVNDSHKMTTLRVQEALRNNRCSIL